MPGDRLKAESLLYRYASAPAVLLIILTLAAYLPALSAGYIWDDDDYVTLNHVLFRPGGLRQIWFEVRSTPQYYPLVFTSFWMEHQLWGLRPVGYHAVNIALHALSAVLLWRILVRLAVPGALLAAALFAVHPVHVESVAWITERKNVLSGMFYFAAFLAYIHWRYPKEPDDPMARDAAALTGEGASSGSGAIGYFATILLFVCAILSKSVTASLPAALLVVIGWKRGRLAAFDIRPLIPLFILGLAGGLATAWVERQHVGAQGPDFDLTVAQRILIAGRALWFYMGKLCWPNPLIFIYPRWQVDAAQMWQWLYPASAIGVVMVAWGYRKRLGRGPLAALLFFGGTLLPALGLVNVYPMRFSFVADHFQYLASVGPLVLAAALLTGLGAAISRKTRNPWPQRIVAFAAVTPLIGLAYSRSLVYQDVERLWRNTIAQNPGCWMAHGNLAGVLAQRGQFDDAIAHAQAQLDARPDLPGSYSGYAQILVLARRLNEAVQYFRQGLAIDPKHFRSNFEYGVLLLEHADYAEAIIHLEAAVAQRPAFPPVHQKLALAYSLTGRHALAIQHYLQALAIEPTARELLWELARAYDRSGQTDAAISTLNQTVRLHPKFGKAYSDLGSLLGKQGHVGEAIACLRRALELRPNDLVARFNLACLLDDQGQAREAILLYRQVLKANPDDQEADRRLRAALMKTGNSELGS